MSKFYATDKLADPSHIKWILNKRLRNEPEKNDIIMTLQLGLEALQGEYNRSGISKKQKLNPQIHAIEVRLAKLRQNLSFYVEANHEDTVAILGEKWLADKKQSMKPYEFKVAIQNEDPDRPEDGFYPDFNPLRHGYSLDSDADYNPAQPLIIAADYQHSVSPIAVVQLGALPGQVTASVNYIQEFYTLAPQGLEAAVEMLCDHYRSHVRKLIYYVYDQTATGRRNDALEYYKIIIAKLKQNGWAVISVYTGAAPTHFAKYSDTKKWLKNEQGLTKDIRVNRRRCPKLIKSVISAPAKISRGKTEKDKSGEQNAKLDQSETTHFSDVFDMLNHAIIGRSMINASASRIGSGTAFR